MCIALTMDAFKDETYLEWILSRKSGGETDALYGDLLQANYD